VPDTLLHVRGSKTPLVLTYAHTPLRFVARDGGAPMCSNKALLSLLLSEYTGFSCPQFPLLISRQYVEAGEGLEERVC
jgi:hypothetical protein